MKILSNIISAGNCLLLMAICCLPVMHCYAQDSDSTAAPAKAYVGGTFSGNLLIDNQTVMVPVKQTFEFSIQHRFGTVTDGYSDFYGLFAGANVRFGFAYTPINNLQLGIGLCEEKMQLDGNAKYALIKQAKSGGSPVSVSLYGNMSVSTLPKEGNFVNNGDRISYFSQLIIARKITPKLSVQVSPGMAYFNNIDGYVASDGSIQPTMKNANFSLSFMGRYKVTEGMSIMVNYDQPLTQNPTNNPHPNVSFGLELSTIGHSFQIFATNYQSINPQANNVFNQNDFSKGQYLIGFNITRRWYHDSE